MPRRESGGLWSEDGSTSGMVLAFAGKVALDIVVFLKLN